MALLKSFSCDRYGADADMQADGWSSTNWVYVTPSTTEGRFGEGAIGVGNVYYAQQSFSVAAATVFIQGAFKAAVLPSVNRDLLVCRNNGGADLVCELEVTSGGAIVVKDSAGSAQYTTATGIIKPSVWQYIEVKVVSHASAGVVRVRVDGVEVANVTSMDTSVSATDIDVARFGSGNAGGDSYWDDILIMDDAGSANNDNIGDQRIIPRLPTSDDSQADWSLSAGANGYELIDDTIPGSNDGDTTYIYDSTAANKSLFGMENLDTTPASIAAVVVKYEAKKTDAGARTMRAYIDSNSTTANGTTQSIGTDYESYSDIFEVDPDTSSAWTESGVNALLVGVDLVS